MQLSNSVSYDYQEPQLLKKAQELANYVSSLPVEQLATAMHLSSVKAAKTHTLMQLWNASNNHLPAIDAFLGDIYSGLQAHSLSANDRAYANEHLYILSGLYGVLKALDSIMPYRLEMGYRLPNEPYKNLYAYWNDAIAKVLPADKLVINLSAVEYTKAVLPYLRESTIIAPKFMTISPKTGEPTFVVVHAKIARGAYAHWLIKNRINDLDNLMKFNELGYTFDAELSTATEPVFVCQKFAGIGLSVRLTA